MLEVQARWQLPLLELSGLARRRANAAGEARLVAVCDDGRIATARLSAADGVSQVTTLNVASDDTGSDFEGVASDGARVFVLQERNAQVLVFDVFGDEPPDGPKPPERKATDHPPVHQGRYRA